MTTSSISETMDIRSRSLDLTNLPVTCANNEALYNFNKGIEAYVSLKENSAPWFQAALECQKDLVIAHCLLVRYRYIFLWSFCEHIIVNAYFYVHFINVVTGLLSIIQPKLSYRP